MFTGVLGGLSLPGVFEDAAAAAEPPAKRGPALDEFYLERGLNGMVRAKGWFDAHWGAGVIAGYYLCKENALPGEVIEGIRKQLDTVIQQRPEQFKFLPKDTTDAGLIEEVPKALPQALKGGLRAHGHAVIFASLSTRALKQVPHMAQPAIIEGLCDLSRQIAKLKVQAPQNQTPYPNSQAMIEALFDSLARFEPVLGKPGIRRPNFTHMTTHTEALMNLEMMGYGELAKSGYAGHRVHISAPVPEVDASAKSSTNPASLETVMSRRYWDDEKNQDRWSHAFNVPNNPNGDWIASGHLFKVLYSYHRLIRKVKDVEKVRLCSRVLLERYMNPEVQGG